MAMPPTERATVSAFAQPPMPYDGIAADAGAEVDAAAALPDDEERAVALAPEDEPEPEREPEAAAPVPDEAAAVVDGVPATRFCVLMPSARTC